MSMSQMDRNEWLATPRVKGWLGAAIAVAVVLATVDLIFACTYWHQMYGVPVARLIQTIASGLLGTRAYAGGMHTVLLGLLLQYLMMFMMVSAYYLSSSRMPRLHRHPWGYGLLYGMLLYIVMNEVVVPLSAAPKTPFVMSWVLGSLVMHGAIGVVTAHGARRISA